MSATSTQHLSITAAQYTSGYKIELRFNDDTERVVDFGPFLQHSRNPDIQDFRDLDAFKSFRIEDGNLMWGDFKMIFPIMDLYRGELS
jgi:hypothetical protein